MRIVRAAPVKLPEYHRGQCLFTGLWIPRRKTLRGLAESRLQKEKWSLLVSRKNHIRFLLKGLQQSKFCLRRPEPKKCISDMTPLPFFFFPTLEYLGGKEKKWCWYTSRRNSEKENKYASNWQMKPEVPQAHVGGRVDGLWARSFCRTIWQGDPFSCHWNYFPSCLPSAFLKDFWIRCF